MRQIRLCSVAALVCLLLSRSLQACQFVRIQISTNPWTKRCFNKSQSNWYVAYKNLSVPSRLDGLRDTNSGYSGVQFIHVYTSAHSRGRCPLTNGRCNNRCHRTCRSRTSILLGCVLYRSCEGCVTLGWPAQAFKKLFTWLRIISIILKLLIMNAEEKSKICDWWFHFSASDDTPIVQNPPFVFWKQ